MPQDKSGVYNELTSRYSVLQISETVFSRFQYIAVTLFIVLGTCFYIYTHYYTYYGDPIRHWITLFNVGREDSMPTVFSAFNMLVSSILLFMIYRHSKGHGEPISVYWLCLCILLFVLSIDEVASIHERFQKLQSYTGVLIPLIETHSWLLYGSIFTFLAFLFFFRFLKQLDRRTAIWFLISGFVFLSGALGFEFVGAWMMYNEVASRGDFMYSIRRIFEEGCEMLGIAIFNCTLFSHITMNRISLTVMSDDQR